MSVLLEALKKAAQKDEDVSSQSHVDTEQNGVSQSESSPENKLNIRLKPEHADDWIAENNGRDIEFLGEHDPFDDIPISVDDKREGPDENVNSDELNNDILAESVEGFDEKNEEWHVELNRSGELSASKVLTHSYINSLSDESFYSYIRKALLLLFIPVGFVLVIFYSAAQWYSKLSDEFHSRYNPSNVLHIVNEYKKISGEVVESEANRLDEINPDLSSIKLDQLNQGASISTGGIATSPPRSGSSYTSIDTSTQTQQLINKNDGTESDPTPNPISPSNKGRAGLEKKSAQGDKERNNVNAGIVDSASEFDDLYLSESINSKVRHLIADRKLDEALKLAKEALKKDHDNVDLMFLTAYAYFDRGLPELGMKWLEKALAVDPYHKESAELLAQELVARRGVHSISDLYKLNKHLPDSDVISSLLASMLVRDNKIDGAINVLVESFRLNKKPDLAYNIALLYVEKGNARLAREYALEAIRLTAKENHSFNDQEIASLIDRINSMLYLGQ